MTLTSELTKVIFNGNDSTKIFAVSFIYYDNDGLKVILTDVTGIEAVQTLDVAYTLSGGSGATGTLTMTTAPASGELLTIKSDISDTQESDFPLGGNLQSTSIENQLDIIVRLIQQKEERLNRAILLEETSENSGVTIADAIPGEFLRWKGDGNIDSTSFVVVGSALAVDETDTSTTKDKLTSNALAKRAEDTAQAVNGIQVASAVNQLQVTNSIAGNPVLIEATGTDSSIHIQINAKGPLGAILIGHSISAGVNRHDVVLKNDTGFRFVNQFSNSTELGMKSTINSDLEFMVPTGSDEYIWSWSGLKKMKFLEKTGGAGILFVTEVITDHDAPADDGCIIFTSDAGSGKTQLMARFPSGAVQQIAVEP